VRLGSPFFPGQYRYIPGAVAYGCPWPARSVLPSAASGLLSLRRRCILSACPPAFARYLGLLV
jgi:hypothetical protein